jgi:two-component system OmpR family sensor kinase
MNRFSLRTRLVALAVVLVALAVTLVGVATYTLLSSYLYDQLDNRLVQTAGDSARAAPSILANRDLGPGGARIDRDTCAVWVQDDGVQTLFRPADDPSTLDLRTAQHVVSEGRPTSVRATTGEWVRAIPASITINDTKLQLVVTLPRSGVDDTLHRLLAVELVIGGAAVLAVGVLGAIGVRLEMRPLARVTRTARTVAAELGPDGSGLDNRVPNADPRTEVGQLAEAVNTMLGAVEQEYAARYESEQRLRRFLADASHELRTPLTSLRGYAELVRMRGGLDPEASDSLRRIEAEGTRMGGLVDDLLTLARSDRGTVVERVPVDLADVVDDAVADLRAAHPQRQVSVTDRGPLMVLGDRDQLLQVVANILTNAAVHATAPVPIQVTAAQEGAEVVVRVVDGGPGLPPEQAAQVFDRFWRADAARTRVRGGSGLGLSIVAALVADHGGRVAFDSTVEHGTTVTVWLPAAPAAGETLSSESAPPAPAPAPR